MKKLIIILCLISLLSGCATMFSENNYHIPVMSVLPAHVTVTNIHTGDIEAEGSTPLILTLKSKRSYARGAKYAILVEKKGYIPYKQKLEASFSKWVIGDVFLDFGIFSVLAFDLPTGNIWNLDDTAISACLMKRGKTSEKNNK